MCKCYLGVAEVSRALELILRIKSHKPLVRNKPDALAVPLDISQA
jgi:hypothetical protein